VPCSHTLKYTENSLEHWITFKYTTDPETVETEAEVRTTHHYEYFKLPTLFIKILIVSILVFNVQLPRPSILHSL
jgi:hypothetical protein